MIIGIRELSSPTWQPIETAPKDGSEILAYSEHGGTGTMLVRHIAMVDFLTDAEIAAYVEDGASDEMLETADWFYADFLHGDRLSPDCYPTHWMPLPPPPSALESRGQGLADAHSKNPPEAEHG